MLSSPTMKKKVLIIILLLSFPISVIGLPQIINYCVYEENNNQKCEVVSSRTYDSNATFNCIDCNKKGLILNTVNDSFLGEKIETQNNDQFSGLNLVQGNCSIKCKFVASNKLTTELPLLLIRNKIYLRNSILII